MEKGISLKPFNTFGIDYKAKQFCTVDSSEDFKALIREEYFSKKDALILGGGSNVLFTKDYEGLVVKNNILGIELISEDNNSVKVKAYSGENWHKFVLHCLDNGWSGIENLSLIPGTVGAAPMQNIGAYGVEIKDVFDSLEAIDLHSGHILRFGVNDCKFGYRESVFKNKFKNKFFILSVTLKLSKRFVPNVTYGDIKSTLEEKKTRKVTAKSVSNAVIKIRKSKLPDPDDIGNSGSFFKNPIIPMGHFAELKKIFPHIRGYKIDDDFIKVPAGWLIENAGWKGKRQGNTGSHKRQALVLVNYGGATGSEVKSLANQIRESVKSLYNIDLTPEVNIY
jgi:UDP-N-acetylmuramate dehydrogenase